MKNQSKLGQVSRMLNNNELLRGYKSAVVYNAEIGGLVLEVSKGFHNHVLTIDNEYNVIMKSEISTRATNIILNSLNN